MSKLIVMPRSGGGRWARPATWWISARGNIRLRCPNCAKTIRLILKGLWITPEGRLVQKIAHHGCGPIGAIVLERITGEERDLLFPGRTVRL